MTKVKDILQVLFEVAPAYMKYDWDHVGLLCGREEMEVTRVMVALDPTPDVLVEAKERGAELVLTHHPLFFGTLDAVNDQTLTGRSLLYLIENHMAAINLHTNLDCAPGGVNDILAQRLGLSDVRIIEPAGKDAQGREYGLLRCGTVDEMPLDAFVSRVCEKLGCSGVRFADGGKCVHRVAVGGGSCGSEFNKVLAHGCDTFVTADLKYNHFAEAEFHGINVIDAGHFATENPVCEYLEKIVSDAFPEIEVFRSKKHADTTQFLTKG